MCVIMCREMDDPWGTLRVFYHFQVCYDGLGFPMRTYKFISKNKEYK